MTLTFYWFSGVTLDIFCTNFFVERYVIVCDCVNVNYFRMEKEFNSDDSGRNTPREVVLTRSDTPGPTPAYIYSRVSC